MPRDGSGNYIRDDGVRTGTDVFQQQQSASTGIDPVLMDTEANDMATALTNSIAKDGQTTPTADLPMGGNKHLNVSDATANDQYSTLDQNNKSYARVISASGSVNAMTGTYPVGQTPSSLVDGQPLVLDKNTVGENTSTAPTLNITGLTGGAITITKCGNQPLAVGDTCGVNAKLYLVYDATTNKFELLNPKFGSGSGAGQFLESANNLDDVDNVVTSRTNLGLGSIATLNSINNSNWSGTALSIGNGGTGATSDSGARSALGLQIGSDVQAYSATLDDWAGANNSANHMPYWVSTGVLGSVSSTQVFGRSLLQVVSATNLLDVLGTSPDFSISSDPVSNPVPDPTTRFGEFRIRIDSTTSYQIAWGRVQCDNTAPDSNRVVTTFQSAFKQPPAVFTQRIRGLGDGNNGFDNTASVEETTSTTFVIKAQGLSTGADDRDFYWVAIGIGN